MMKIYSSAFLFSLLFLVLGPGLSAQDKVQLDKQLLQGNWVLTGIEVKNPKRELPAEEYKQLKDAYLHASPLKYTTLSFEGSHYSVNEKSVEISGPWEITNGSVILYVSEKRDFPAYQRQFAISELTNETLRMDYLKEDYDGNTSIQFIYTKQP